nr:sigma 54-interacting transcriptional regulator [Geomicrobium sp. JCM 19055]
MAMEIEFVKDLNRDLNAILSTMYDEVLIVDKDGTLLRHSDKYIEGLWPDGIDALVGKNLLEVDLQGLPPSVTKLVLKQQKKVSVVQEIPSGDKVLAIGNPVFNARGELERIIIASRDITENIQLKSELRQTKAISNRYKEELESLKNQQTPKHTLIYASEKMERIMKNIEKLSMFSSTVLIHGETGVGKELIAKSIHEKSARSSEPFLALNCGSIPESLLESELFGYTKGSFTGADSKGKPGYFQQADRGVLFLDEIGDIPMSLQVKLLRVLQEGEVVPIGSQTPIPVDVQIIAATHRNLDEMVQEGSFREDLFYRINVVPIHVPPLRERPDDIPLLAYHFIRKLNERYQMRHSFSPDALSLLETYVWPGNIRELQNVVERLFVTADDDLISAEAASQFLRVEKVIKPSTTSPVLASVMPLNDAKQLIENQLLRLAMEQFKTTTKAARALGISQSAVSRKWAKLQSETPARE